MTAAKTAAAVSAGFAVAVEIVVRAFLTRVRTDPLTLRLRSVRVMRCAVTFFGGRMIGHELFPYDFLAATAGAQRRHGGPRVGGLGVVALGMDGECRRPDAAPCALVPSCRSAMALRLRMRSNCWEDETMTCALREPDLGVGAHGPKKGTCSGARNMK